MIFFGELVSTSPDHALEQDRLGLNRSCSASPLCRMIFFGEVVSTSPDHAHEARRFA
jgi:hypothetical protein